MKSCSRWFLALPWTTMLCVCPLGTIGIDEAGRGPVLGPLVMAGVCLETRQAAALTRAGVTDSKAFGSGAPARAARSRLAALIEETAKAFLVRVIDVSEIDRRVLRHELNVLEREHAAAILARLPPAKRIVLDGKRLFAPLRDQFPNIIAADHGELRHVAVAAASILAKVRRDELFALIARRYEPEFGPIRGGGYENPRTHAFICAYVAKYGHLPPETRRSWSWAGLANRLPTGFDPLKDMEPEGQLALF